MNWFPKAEILLLIVLTIASLLTTARAVTAGENVTVIAIQMKVSPDIYQDYSTFEDAVRDCMESARPHFGSGQNLVAFPEDIGLGLAIMQDDLAYIHLLSLKSAVSVPVIQLDYSILHDLFIARKDFIRTAYYNVFKTMAEEYKDYNVTIVAGSAPIADENDLVYNTSYVFGPGGVFLGQQRKVHLLDIEIALLGLTPAPLNDIHPIETSAGSVGVAICYDSFFDDVVDKLVAEGTQILVQPSFNPGSWTPWQQNDWRKGTWRALRKHKSLVAGVNPMMVGALWDVIPEGRSSITAFTPTGYLDRAVTSNDSEVVWANIEINQ